MLEKKQLTFTIFIIHKLAESWHKSPIYVYDLLNKLNIIDGYIIPCYDVLHTQGKNYLIEDISELVKERGGSI